MNELQQTQTHQVQQLPATQRMGMALAAGGANIGAIAIEQERAIAEAQGQLTLAKRFPRSVAASMTEFLDTCASPDFAKTAFYTVKNRGSGPSIRFAEEAARCYGNFQFGHRELSRSEGKSEVEVYAWDMQNNNYSRRQITVMHILDTQEGPRKLTQQADIDNRIANVASKQMRGRILALLPKHLVAAGIERCKATLAGNSEIPVRERIMKMVQAFSKFGVTNQMLQEYLGHSVDETTVDELADLTGIHNAIKEGAKASDYFRVKADGDGNTTDDAASSLANSAKKGAEQAKTTTPAPSKPATRSQRSNQAQTEGDTTKETVPAADVRQQTNVTTTPADEVSAEQPVGDQAKAEDGGDPPEIF